MGEGSSEFEQKLRLLSDQWHGILQQTNQRKASIDNALANWVKYESQVANLRQKLADVSASISSLETGVLPLQMLTEQLQKCQVN